MKKEKKKKKKTKTEGKYHDQILMDVSDYELYRYALERYKSATGDKLLSITHIIIYLEKEIRYYRRKIAFYENWYYKDGE